MTISTDFDFSTNHAHSDPMPVAVQVLSTILFAAFAIPVTIIALNVFWPAGILIAVILAWRGGFAPTGRPSPAPRDMDEAMKSLMPTTAQRSSGNASFDAYRHDMIERLEIEQEKFEGFLSRLRHAKDQSEFDTFLDQRAAALDD
ncbi:DUF2852 domain-containing protein [Octadecabacter sp. 1_MG-2023]|uniref:DUF2852 domain-containing protein n=1 Tax=unclassified Octadecabacter TaxID=196158 RepID=UPI001C089512|nr:MULTISPECIES: DUF2852 domain-containing protein [unclassified Octadecabacter]MBU2993650.1 DUF2852 domain-containing protein [Octadecabacter sp. B2R22]MDO6735506.1 DUF2852 domain-containing protein [Octadecabacter sp. 1_MG-2023]